MSVGRRLRSSKPSRVALAAVPGVAEAVALLSLAREASGDRVSSFELIPRIGLDFVVGHMTGNRDPLAAPSPWYVLIDLTTAAAGSDLHDAMETLLERALDAGLVTDATIAQSKAQRGDLWKLREDLSESQKYEGGSIKHDISVPIGRIPEFIAAASASVTALVPGCRPVPFGHMGDGNIHFNVSQPVGMDKQVFLDGWAAMSEKVHDIAAMLGGSISAEHGVGQLKVDEIVRYKSPVEIELMHRLKRTLDPQNTLNPGKVVTPGDE